MREGREKEVLEDDVNDRGFEICDRTKNTYGSMILSLLNLQCRLIKLLRSRLK